MYKASPFMEKKEKKSFDPILLFRVCVWKVFLLFVGDSYTGDRRNGNERGGRSKNSKNDFSAQLLPKILAF